MSKVIHAAVFLLISAEAVEYSEKNEGYAQGFMPICPGFKKPADIKPEHLKKLKISVLGKGSILQAKWTSYNYENIKSLAKDPEIDFNRKTIVYAPGYMESTALTVGRVIMVLYKRLGYNVLILEYVEFTTNIFPIHKRSPSPDQGTGAQTQECPDQGTGVQTQECPDQGTGVKTQECPDQGTGVQTQECPDQGAGVQTQGCPDQGTGVQTQECPDEGTGVQIQECPDQGTGVQTQECPDQGTGVETQECPDQGTGVRAQECPDQGTGVKAQERSDQGTGVKITATAFQVSPGEKGRIQALAQECPGERQTFIGPRSTGLITKKVVRLARPIGKHAAEMLASLTTVGLDPKNLELVGLSLGGVTMPFIARNFRQITGSNISAITALDPAGPCLWHAGPEDRLDPSDADFVLSIATNTAGYGTAIPVGHVTIFVNGGEFQSGILPSVLCDDLCSHTQALWIWMSALEHPGSFIALQCDSMQQARDHKCHERTPMVTNTMDLHTDRSKPGIYYLATRHTYPFYLGKQGLKRSGRKMLTHISELNAVDVLRV